jgi:uncharacterized FlaG/YvyC family protein
VEIVHPAGGNTLPASGKAATGKAATATAEKPPVPAAPAADKPPAPAKAATAPAPRSNVEAQVALLNKFLNDSGRPAQFRVDPASDAKLIQEINPATGEVIGEYPAISFPALARSVGISGALIDERA